MKLTLLHCGTYHIKNSPNLCFPICFRAPFPPRSLIMVDLFLNRVLVENNWDQDELNTEREIVGILENRILLLFFATAQCGKCQEFVPVLNDFFKRLKDPAYIEYPKLLALIYIRSSFLLIL